MSAVLPPDPFEPEEATLEAGTLLYRVGNISRSVSSFNPGHGQQKPTRFAFFNDPPVPVLYAAETEESALAESLLHDIPLAGGILGSDDYMNKVMGRLLITRDVRLASLRGLGLRKLKVTDTQVTNTDASEYGTTVAWAKAAHDAGFEGLEWTSRLCNDSRAVVLFGDRATDAVEQDTSFGRHFLSGDGLDWLITTCLPLHVEVMPPA